MIANAKTNEELFGGLPGTRDELITRNRPLVIRLAKKLHCPVGLDLDEVIQEGMVAMAMAVDGYNPRRGIKFISYAGTAVYRRMVRYINTNYTAVRLPSANKHARERMHVYREQAKTMFSLDGIGHTGDDCRSRRDKIEVADSWTEEDRDNRVDAETIIAESLAREIINPRQAYILRERSIGRQLGEIGKVLGVTRERVRQIETKAIEKLREVYL